jgi:hypothetical protein
MNVLPHCVAGIVVCCYLNFYVFTKKTYCENTVWVEFYIIHCGAKSAQLHCAQMYLIHRVQFCCDSQ